jgi:hypothetical protein
MHLTDLLFLVAMLATLVAAIRILWCLARGAPGVARRTAVGWAVGALVYFTVLLVVSRVQSGRVVPLGDDECFDDWCIAVTAMERHDGRMVVTLRVSNHGRGRTQAEPDAYVYLRDDGGHELQPSALATAEATASLGDQVPPGQAQTVQAVFDVRSDDNSLSLVKARRARFPGIVIIGDPSSLLHRPTVHALR